MIKKMLSLVLLGCAIATSTALAEIKVNGFASFTAGMTLDEPDAVAAAERLNNIYDYGYTDELTVDNESLFGIQVTADLMDGLSVTAQALSQGVNDYDTELFATYLTYEVNENWRINAGRMPWALFQFTDYLNVGYAYPWISGPRGMYGFVPDITIDGVVAIYNTYVGDWDLTFQPYTDLNSIFGLKSTATYDWITLNAVFVGESSNVFPVPLFDAASESLREAGFEQQAEDVRARNDRGRFFSLGYNIDYNDWIAIGEYAQINFVDASFYSDMKNYFFTFGRRVNDLTFHVTYDVQNEDPQLDFKEGLPPGQLVNVGGNMLPISVLEGIFRGGSQEYRNITLGVRYDFHPSAALKVDFVRNKTDDGDEVIGIKEAEQDFLRFSVQLVY
ncbi:hypothetical protein [Agaribacter marinus]|uniref:Porin n=1 Tax=Agaribacter marinus TaxID=1431249 RepID=A0AA37WIS7_9ALTE|nr:hypothetical protein [Agaribacter marinus]GLR69754.1 hypothetical protein GCM10007852_06620 [Agaribacter marinus]